MELRIGCTGWSYAGWAGPFYPRNMAASGYLSHYSASFDVTEINSTFYRIPTRPMARKWFEETPEGFQFTAKVPRHVTHESRLAPNPFMGQFLDSIEPLGSKMKILVFQLPPSLTFEESMPRLEKLSRYLPGRYRYAVEGRHPSWFSDSACRFLSEQKFCLVWNEVDGVENPAPVTADFVYLRLVGDRSIPDEEFGQVRRDKTAVLQKWAGRLESVRDRLSLAVIVANNHLEGFGPVTANKMRVLLGLDYVTWGDRDQRSLADYDEHN